MPKAVKVSPLLNHDRLRIIRKGHANVSDLQKFIPASRTKAQVEYQTIAVAPQIEIAADGNLKA